MKKDTSGTDPLMLAMRRAAMRHPDVEEGLACKGTVIQSATFKIRGKAFLFLRPGKAMLKLGKSQLQAAALAKSKPRCYSIGSGGWASVTLTSPKDLSMSVLTRWVAESYGLFAASPAPGRKRGARRRTGA